MSKELIKLAQSEGWDVKDGIVEAYGKKFPLVDPFAIYCKLYRDESNPELKYQHFKRMHDIAWPKEIATWHSWTEDRFRAHCEGYNYISYAGGASTAKSRDEAKIDLLFWLSDPKNNAVIVVSTSLNSLGKRIWGYILNLLTDLSFKTQYVYLRSQPPKVLYTNQDLIHGIFCTAAKQGDDDAAIKNIIGQHPNKRIKISLDEASDLPPAILKALPNLESGVEFFQCTAIANSASKFDLHGAISTPAGGWPSIDPMKDTKWPTTQKNGICLFFSCYNSPAIFEKDPVRKARLSKFLITKEQIESKERVYGKDSDSFWRFVLGFWRSSSSDDTVISREFINTFRVFDKAEWAGIFPLHLVAGLDPAFSTGGDQCMLQLAILGQTTSGQIVLDYRGGELQFNIPIVAQSEDSVELQIADQVLAILAKHGCALHHLCVDANGQGRALGEVLRLRSKQLRGPVKIYSVKSGNTPIKSFDVVVKTPHELWFGFREFIQHGQIKGIDDVSAMQLTSRLVVVKGGKQYLESKVDYKNRMGSIMPSLARSPDEADACSLALQSAIMNFGFTPGQRREISGPQDFAHDKYWVFNQMRKVEEVPVQREGPPVATFAGALGDIKTGFL